MAQEIDWLSSQAGMCKISLYSPQMHKDHDRKVICFVDAASARLKDRKLGTNVSSNITDPAGDCDLTNLEEKEVIIIKDNEQNNYLNTEGAVCLFKHGLPQDRNVVSWLSNDLQKYAIGFQHALTPLKTQSKSHTFDTVSQNNNNTAPNSSSNEGGNSDDLAYYANKLCSLVVEMTRKEIQDQWESSGKCIRHLINPYSSGGKATPNEGGGTKSPAERSTKEDDPFLSDTVNENVFKQQEGVRSDKARKSDDGTSISKGMMVYANQVASEMMLSFLKTFKVQKGRHPQPACAVLKEVLLRHTKEIVSDLIDSSMKNLHNITGALMTDSDFVCGLKKNLYNVGTQKTAEVLEVIVKRLFKLLSVDDKQARSQSLAFTSYKTAGTSNQKAQGMQFASMKSESCGREKHSTGMPGKTMRMGSHRPDKQESTDVYAKELLLTALMQIQQHLLERTKDSRYCDTNSSSYGYGHRDPSYDRAGGSHANSPYNTSRDFYQSDSLREKGNLLLCMVQKILQEAGLNLDDGCGDKSRG